MGRHRQVGRSSAALRALPGGRAAGLALASFIDWSGTGVWLTTSTILMVRVVHLHPAQVGLGLTGGGMLGLAAVWPVTTATRRWPVRWVAVTLYLLRGLFFLSFLFVKSAPTYYVATALVAIVNRPATSVNQVLVSRYVPDEQRSTTLAAMHVATNAGLMTGSLLASVALLLPSRTSMDAVVLANSLSFVLAAWQVGRAAAGPRTQTGGAASGSGSAARAGWLTWRFLFVTIGCGVLALLFPLFNVEIPLWLTTKTQVPAITVSVLFLLNTILVVLFQSRLTKWATGIRNGVRAGAVAGVCVIGCCGLLAALPGLVTWVATGGFVLAAGLLTLGEMNQGSAAWTLSFGLSPEAERTRALALFNTGQAAAFVVGPALCTSVIAWAGRAGFAVLAATVAAGIGCVIVGGQRSVAVTGSLGEAGLA